MTNQQTQLALRQRSRSAPNSNWRGWSAFGCRPGCSQTTAKRDLIGQPNVRESGRAVCDLTSPLTLLSDKSKSSRAAQFISSAGIDPDKPQPLRCNFCSSMNQTAEIRRLLWVCTQVYCSPSVWTCCPLQLGTQKAKPLPFLSSPNPACTTSAENAIDPPMLSAASAHRNLAGAE